jgi:SH3 domain-containing protein/NlpC/P60 family protein
LRFGYPRLRAAAFAALMSVFIVSTGAPAPVAASTPADSIIALAKTKLGRPWVHYAVGPRAFDCSGLVYFVFRKTGHLRTIGGLRSARGLYVYFRNRGRASRSGGRPGDLVVWGGGSHVGIYLGHGKAISTLTNGVRIHGIFAVRARFTAFLHTRMSVTAARAIAASVPTVAPAVAAPTLAPAPSIPPDATLTSPTDAAATPVPAPSVAPDAASVAPATTDPATDPAADVAATPTPTVDPATTLAPTVAPGTATTTVAPSTAALPKSATTRRTTVRLNLRKGPGTATHVIRILRPGMRLTILRSRNDTAGRLWYKVRLNSGLTGWVASWYTRA